MSALNELKKHLRPGQVYRRADLARWSKAVDRHVGQLVEEGVLRKLSQGLYAYPKRTSFGTAPPEDEKLVRAFLKSDDFLLTSLNAYNTLGVGTTQLYNECVAYNRKRHGKFELGGRVFDFRMKPKFPKRPTEEFLLVDLVNNLDQLAEDRESVLDRTRAKALAMQGRALTQAVNAYANERTKKLFKAWLKTDSMVYAH